MSQFNTIYDEILYKLIESHKCPCGCKDCGPKCPCDEKCECKCKHEKVEEAAEKKSKPDYMDVDDDGDKEESMKKALKDKKSK